MFTIGLRSEYPSYSGTTRVLVTGLLRPRNKTTSSLESEGLGDNDRTEGEGMPVLGLTVVPLVSSTNGGLTFFSSSLPFALGSRTSGSLALRSSPGCGLRCILFKACCGCTTGSESGRRKSLDTAHQLRFTTDAWVIGLASTLAPITVLRLAVWPLSRRRLLLLLAYRHHRLLALLLLLRFSGFQAR